MTTKAETTPGIGDTIKLVFAALVLLAGIVAYYYFDDQSELLRVAGVILALAVGAVIGYQAAQGQLLWQFIQNSRGELRKVIWPTRQETTQTTLTVMVFVLILGVFFWVLDLGLLYLTQILTGRGS